MDDARVKPCINFNMKKKPDIIFVLTISIISIIMWNLPTGFENPDLTKNSFQEKAEVTGVDNRDLQKYGLITTGTQFLKIKILTGEFEDSVVTTKNVLMGQMSFDKIYKKGDIVLSVIEKENNRIKSARAEDIYRINIELILFFLFAFFLISFAGWTGFKALLSFVFTALSIWKILIPFLLKGVNPVLTTLIIVFITTTVIILLISGFTKKGTVALSGSITGVLITAILSVTFGYFFRVPGSVKEFSEILLYAGFVDLKLSDILISGIFISAAGAVMDVAMDISAAQDELIAKTPGLSQKELILSGFKIARPVIGTMTTTLLFAYSGSFIFVFMVFMAKGTPAINIFNINFVAAEILHTMVGSFGLVLVAPVTAIIGGYVFTKK